MPGKGSQYNEQADYEDHRATAQQHNFADQIRLHQIAAPHSEYLRPIGWPLARFPWESPALLIRIDALLVASEQHIHADQV